MQQPEFKLDAKAIERVRGAMRFMVVRNESEVESMFAQLDEATDHALEVVPFGDKPVHVCSISHGDCVLTIWPKYVEGEGDDNGEQ